MQIDNTQQCVLFLFQTVGNMKDKENMNEIQYKAHAASIERKEAGEDGSLHIKAYALAFGNVDSWGDIIAPGACDKFLASEDFKRMALCYQHNISEVVGVITDAGVDEKGMWIEADVLPTTTGKDVQTLIKAGAIKEFSIGYYATEYHFEKVDGYAYDIRVLDAITIVEVSPVTRAANPQAVLLDAKNEGAEQTEEVKDEVQEDAPEIKEENSNEPAGTVIAQSPEAGEKVIPGSKVKLTVSNGIPESRMANLEITLPASGSTRGSFEVFVNNESKLSKNLLMDGSNYPFEVEGSGENASVKVFIDNKEYYSCIVDFTQDPPVVINGSYSSSGSSKRAIPNVVGMTMQQAISQLESSGFRNYQIQQQPVYNDSENGRVISQSPSATSSSIIGITQTYSLDTVVTLVVGQKEGI